MADRIIQLKDSNGNNLYPLAPASHETYLSGDTFQVCSGTANETSFFTTGTITNSATRILFTITTPKSMQNVTPSVSSLKENFRQWNNYVTKDGWVTGGTQLVGASGYTVTCQKINDYYLTVLVEKSSRFKDAIVNNAPIAMEIAELVISFA